MARHDAKRKQNLKGNYSEAELDRRHTRWMHAFSVLGTVAGKTVFVIGAVAMVYCGVYLPVLVSAGEPTSVTLAVNWLGSLKVDVIAAWSVAAGCGIGWKSERRSKHKERKTKDERIAKLEKLADPGRSSSNLTPEGKPVKGKQNESIRIDE